MRTSRRTVFYGGKSPDCSDRRNWLIYIHHIGNIQDNGKRKSKPVAPVLGHFGRRNRPK